MNRPIVWDVAKKLQKTGSTIDRKAYDRKRRVLNSHLGNNTIEKLRRRLGHSCRKLVVADGASKFSFHKVQREDKGKKCFRMSHEELIVFYELVRVDKYHGVFNVFTDNSTSKFLVSQMTIILTSSVRSTSKLTGFVTRPLPLRARQSLDGILSVCQLGF